jgi:hypothetical protein
MTEPNAGEMRKYMALLESTQPEERVDEGLLDNMWTAAKSLFSMGSLGRYEMLSLYNPYERQFRRAMGQKNQNYDTVTWKTLMNFLISRIPLSLKFPKNMRATKLTKQDVLEILNQRRLRDTTFNAIRDGLPEDATVEFLPTGQTIMQRLENLISGEDTSDAQKSFVGKTVVNAYLMQAVMRMLEKSQGGEDFEQEPSRGSVPPVERTDPPTTGAPVAPTTGSAGEFVRDLTSTLRASGADDTVIDAINQFAIGRGIR